MQWCPCDATECPVLLALESGAIHDNGGFEFEEVEMAGFRAVIKEEDLRALIRGEAVSLEMNSGQEVKVILADAEDLKAMAWRMGIIEVIKRPEDR